MKVKLVVGKAYDIPEYHTPGSAGMDLHANNEQSIVLQPGERKVVPTGLKVKVPDGYELQIRPRSGLVNKHGITVLNAPGTIDSDYIGEIGVILFNADLYNGRAFYIHKGDRIAQAVLAKVEQAEWEEVEQLEATTRGEGGFGSTGK